MRKIVCNRHKVLGVFISLIIAIFGQNAWGEDMNILQGNVRFKLAIEGHGLKYRVMVNGVIVFTQLEQKNQNNLELPINHLMHPEKSKFSIYGGPQSADKFPSGGSVKLTLIVEDRDSNATYRLPILTLDGGDVYKPSHIEGILVSGRYHLASNNEIKFGSGEIELNEIIKDSKKSGWFDYSREISLPNSLPLWSFFNSDILPNYDAMSDKDYYVARDELFVEYKKIQDALARGDVDSIMPMFAERSHEVDLAFDYPEGEINRQLKMFMLNLVEDPEWELRIRKPKDAKILLEPNHKIVSLIRNTQNLIGFVNSKNGMYKSIPIKFRRQNGQWIITR